MTLLSHPIVQAIMESLVVELFLTIIGVLIAHTIIKYWNEKRHGGWRVTVIKNGEIKIADREISSAKIKQIKDMPEEKPVFLKGICSPYHYIREDLMKDENDNLEEDRKQRRIIAEELLKDGNKVLFEDRKQRRIIVNLDNDQNEPSQKMTAEKSPATIFIQTKLMEDEKERPGLISFDEDKGRIIIELVEEQPETTVEKGL